MKTIKPANRRVRPEMISVGRNRIQLPWYAQVLSVEYDAEHSVAVLLFAVDSSHERREVREFYVAPSPETHIPHDQGQATTYIGAVQRPGHPLYLVFEIGSPEEKRARAVAMNGSQRVQINNHVGDVGPGGHVFQGGDLGRVHAPMRHR